MILLTGWSHLETAVQLVKAGAADYMSKPWDDAKLLATVENLLELSENARVAETARVSRRRRRAALERDYDLRGIVFASDEMLRVLELACQVARAEVPVVITGPNGAGKERVAEIVHANSAIRDKPLVTVNCGALPSELIEAELFGAEAGAFTGATRAREGRFEAADGGTLFLDEIGNLPAAGQMKLLRVLESGEFERLGSTRTRKVKVRVISATNADLPRMIHDGKFREDLFYRLNTIEIALPPLSDRPDDILPLAERFLDDDAVLSDEARDALLPVAGQRARAQEHHRPRQAVVRPRRNHVEAPGPVGDGHLGGRAQSGRSAAGRHRGGPAQGRRRDQPRRAFAGSVAAGAVQAHAAFRHSDGRVRASACAMPGASRAGSNGRPGMAAPAPCTMDDCSPDRRFWIFASLARPVIPRR